MAPPAIVQRIQLLCAFNAPIINRSPKHNERRDNQHKSKDELHFNTPKTKRLHHTYSNPLKGHCPFPSPELRDRCVHFRRSDRLSDRYHAQRGRHGHFCCGLLDCHPSARCLFPFEPPLVSYSELQKIESYDTWTAQARLSQPGISTRKPPAAACAKIAFANPLIDVVFKLNISRLIPFSTLNSAVDMTRVNIFPSQTT